MEKEIIIRFEQEQDMQIKIPLATTCQQLCDLIYQSRPHLLNRFLRIFSRGRQLLPTETMHACFILSGTIIDVSVVHCAISDQKPIPQQPITRQVGFDRLTQMGLTPQDINEIRQEFSQGRVDVQNEELWLNQEESVDYQVDMLYGLLLGFFGSLFILFWLREGLFTRRQQLGIVTGLFINLSFGILSSLFY